MNFWVTSDTHLGHDNIVKAGHRPAGFESKILDGLKVVQPSDVLIHLGDVAFKNPLDWVKIYRKLCKGRWWVVLGNHDKSVNWFLDAKADYATYKMSMRYHQFNILFTHEPQEDLTGHDFNIHGHLHSGGHHDSENPPKTAKHILVAIENHYYPYSLKELLKTRRA